MLEGFILAFHYTHPFLAETTSCPAPHDPALPAHHELLLDGVHLLLFFPPSLRNEQSSLEQEHASFLPGLPVVLLAREEVLQDQGPKLVQTQCPLNQTEVDGIVGLGGDATRHLQAVVYIACRQTCPYAGGERGSKVIISSLKEFYYNAGLWKWLYSSIQ